jgi:predicted nucleic acid-binding protein
MVIIDTSVIIDHLRQQGEKESHILRLAKSFQKQELAISVITLQELYEGKSTTDKRKEGYMISTIAPLKILQYNYETAKKAGQIARGLTNPIEFADCAISATCILNNAKLATLNNKDFEKIPDLELVDI